jgi:hypothetical protein
VIVGTVMIVLRVKKKNRRKVHKVIKKGRTKAVNADLKRHTEKAKNREGNRAYLRIFVPGMFKLHKLAKQAKEVRTHPNNHVRSEGPPPSAQPKPKEQKPPSPDPAPPMRPLVATLRQNRDDVSPATQEQLRANGQCGHYIADLNRLCHNPQWGGKPYCWVDGHSDLTPAPGAKQESPADAPAEAPQSTAAPRQDTPKSPQKDDGKQPVYWVLSGNSKAGTLTPIPAPDQETARKIRGQERAKGRPTKVLRHEDLGPHQQINFATAHKYGDDLDMSGQILKARMNNDGSIKTDSKGRIVRETPEEHGTGLCYAVIDKGRNVCHNRNLVGKDHCRVRSHAGKTKRYPQDYKPPARAR